MGASLTSLSRVLLIASTFVWNRSAFSSDHEVESRLTLDRIFASDEFESESFGPVRWIEGGSAFTVVEPSTERAGGHDIVRYGVESGQRRVLVSADRLTPPGRPTALEISDHVWSADGSKALIYTNTRRVWRDHTRGDYWVLDVTSRELKKLGGNAKPSTLMFAKFAPDGLRVAYVRENNIYVEDLRGGGITQLTSDGSDRVINGTSDWVYEEELSVRDGFRWSPDGEYVAYWQFDTARVREFVLVDNLSSLYPRLTRFPYPKVGEVNSACRIGVVSRRGGRTRWLEIPGDPREHYVARMDWAANSEELLVQQLNRLQNTNRLFLGDVSTGTVELVLTERDEAWVEVHDDVHWLDGGDSFTWLSERDGWRHAYVVSRSGEETRLVTPGAFDVIGVAGVDEAGGWLYFSASPDNPTQSYLYRARLDGSTIERLTPDESSGFHSYQLAPGAGGAIHTRSAFGEPPVTRLIRLPDHDAVNTLVTNRELRGKVASLARSPAEFFRVDVGDGVVLDGWCLKPPELDPKSKYPLLFYVYGEPAGRTVVDRWGGKSYLWHLLLAQHGYLVFSVDNRGTRVPRGRAWRKSVYRQIGILASADQAAATRAILKERPYADPERVGIWGWSGGGSMSLNAIFRYPGLYRTAMAVAPVSNQRFYDTIYQERYMGLPQNNVSGYRNGSPLTYAHQLEGELLIVHGTADDNVHYQSTEVLVDELIRHGKHFTMLAYPNRTHSIREGDNTRRHLYGALTRFLEQKLSAEPRGGSTETTP